MTQLRILFCVIICCLPISILQAQNIQEPLTIEAGLHLDAKATLGEGALFDRMNQVFYWVDIEKGVLYWCDIHAENCFSFAFGKKIGTVVPCDIKEMVAVALEDGIYLFNTATKELRMICSPEKNISGNRFNDGKCSPAGSFWVGSMSLTGSRYAGGLYRVRSNGEFVKMIDSVGTSNGIVWSPDHSKMYYIDTPTARVMEYAYDEIHDTISSPKVCVKIPRGIGYPDGMCIDSDGKLWIAHWGGSGVYNWDPETGQLLLKVSVAAKNVTSCAFAGENQKCLFITTARTGNSETELEARPLSGGIFKVETDARGGVTNYFRTRL
ncbi:MAG: SMP-30/gluconolactonase/LRE family protein [Bacteroidales bacterium]